MSAFDVLADDVRWVAWRNEIRGGKPTKVPYCTLRRKAEANDPTTWLTRAAAETLALQLVNGHGGGTGPQLGDLGSDQYLCGADLDSCIDEKGCLAPWAEKILVELDTYAERSPSGTGVKSFFYITAEHVRPFLDLIGVEADKWGTKRGIPGHNGAAHGPGVEIYTSLRFFAVTEQQFPGKPDQIQTLSWDQLQRLAAVIPKAGKREDGPDTSRSRDAASVAGKLYHAGKIKTLEEMIEALKNDPDPGIQAWIHEKADTDGGRQFRKIWELITKNKPSSSPSSGKPTIHVEPGKRHEAADAGIAALVAAGVPFYQRAQGLHRIASVKAKDASGREIWVPGIIPVNQPSMLRALGRNANWTAFKYKKIVEIDPPGAVAEQILNMIGEWPFAPLTGIIQCPTLRRDGSLLDVEGYDEATGFVLTSSVDTPAIPRAPSQEDAERALVLLLELLDEFPFDGEDSKSVALSMLLTPVCRAAMSVAPMHLVNKPTPGTGASYLADVASMIATGETLPVEAMGARYEETEKRLVGSIIAGYPIVGIDNCRGIIEGEIFCQMTERPRMSLRKLGGSEKFRIANSITTFANGINATVAKDMVRRTLLCRIDANLEHPENRQFQRDPLAMVAADRGKYVAACLTIPLAYLAADRPRRLHTLASYGDWCRIVREPLVWLGCADPVATQEMLRGSDPRKAEAAAVFEAWRMLIGVGKQHQRQTKELIKFAAEHHDRSLTEAFLAVAVTRGQNTVDPRRLGHWLAQHEGAIVGKSKLYCDTSDVSRLRWYLDWLNENAG